MIIDKMYGIFVAIILFFGFYGIGLEFFSEFLLSFCSDKNVS